MKVGHLAFVVVLATATAPRAWAQLPVQTVYSFPGNPGLPTSALLHVTDGRVYGTLTQGGPAGAGLVFAADVMPDGTLAPTPLHAFSGPDGRWPVSGLVQGGDGLYGTTIGGGANDRGTIFKITREGVFTMLHSFAGPDGAYPAAALIGVDGSTFYGTTSRGGLNDGGTIFGVSATGAFATLHHFCDPECYGPTPRAQTPYGALIQASDGNFYGTTRDGGAELRGTVYRLTPGGVVTIVHSFLAGGPAGHSPFAGVVQGTDGALYGTTTAGGVPGATGGAVFKLTTAGVLSLVHGFEVPGLIGPYGGVIQGSDGALYGAAASGGSDAPNGGVYRVSLTGDFLVLHAFTGIQGRRPFSGLTELNGAFYGMTLQGGLADHGVFFSVTAGSTFTFLGSIASSDGEAPSDGVILGSDGHLYGTTLRGGWWNKGTIFRMTPAGQLAVLHSFTGTDGDEPTGGLMQASDGNLYGVTRRGGDSNRGTVFRISPAGQFVSLHSFQADEGGEPTTRLLQAYDGVIYGLTSGAPGSLFRVTLNGSFALIAVYGRFFPGGRLVQGPDGRLYGTRLPDAYATPIGFQYTGGSIYRVTSNGSLQTVVAFPCETIFTDTYCPMGRIAPGALALQYDGFLYGLALNGGSNVSGARVFKVDTSGNLLTVHAWTHDEQMYPSSALMLASDGDLYGLARGGSRLYRVATGSSTISALHTVDRDVQGPLTQVGPKTFYGTVTAGQPNAYGFVYRVSLP